MSKTALELHFVYIGATQLTDLELTDMDAECASWLVDGESIPTAGRVVCVRAALGLGFKVSPCNAAHPVRQPERQHPQDLIPVPLHSQALVSSCSRRVHNCILFRT